ncbi:MAG TPA: cellobiose phosphorylase [Ruminiclostridium sp.]
MSKNYWFNSKGGTFILTDPKTGKYWYNQLWNNDGYHAAVSHTGHGLSRYVSEDAKNVDLIQDEQRYLYLRDEENKEIWNIGISPTMIPVGNYRCEHGLEYTRISSEYKGIRGSWFFTVPEKGTYEIWQVTLENTTSQKRTLSVIPSIRFDLGGYTQPTYYHPDTTTNTYFLEELNGIFNWSKNPFQPHERCSGFLAASEKVDYYDGWMEKFHGTPGNAARPDILVNGKNCTNSSATVRERSGVLQNIIELAAGESRTIYYIAGFSTTPETAVIETREALKTAEVVCHSAVERGLRRFGTLRVETPDERINNIMNYWAQKQVSFCMIGKKAVRDNAQITMGLLNTDTVLAERSMRECLSHQFADGHAMLTWSPSIDEHTYSDPPMWLILAVCELIKETGDFTFLNEVIPYFDKGSETVYDHLKRAEKWLTEGVGPHGLPLIRYADWNDALNIPDENAESVFMAMAVAWALNEMASLAHAIKDYQYAEILLGKRKNLINIINRVAWNGDYYVRAFSKYGVVGDKDSPVGGNIYLNPQSWSVLGDVVLPENQEKMFAAVDDMETPYGIPLCKPAYREYYYPVGRMSGMLPGVYENGGVYHHACGFKVMADCKAGRSEEALASIRKMIPDGKDTPSSITTTEPYVFTNCYLLHDSSVFNVVGFSWQTGTSAWALRGFYEGILGLRRTYEGLEVSPVMSKEWQHVTAKRTFRGCTYILEYLNNGSSRVELTVDGEKIQGTILPIFTDGQEHSVTVELK